MERTHKMLTAHVAMGDLGIFIIFEDGSPRFWDTGWDWGYHNLLIGTPVKVQGYLWMTNLEEYARDASTRGLVKPCAGPGKKPLKRRFLFGSIIEYPLKQSH
jgi:hypothetical protein